MNKKCVNCYDEISNLNDVAFNTNIGILCADCFSDYVSEELEKIDFSKRMEIITKVYEQEYGVTLTKNEEYDCYEFSDEVGEDYDEKEAYNLMLTLLYDFLCAQDIADLFDLDYEIINED